MAEPLFLAVCWLSALSFLLSIGFHAMAPASAEPQPAERAAAGASTKKAL